MDKGETVISGLSEVSEEDEVCILNADEGGAGVELIRQFFEGSVGCENLWAAGGFDGSGIVCGLL